MESSACPFGSEYQHYWDRLSPLEQRMKIDLEGLYSMAQQSIMDQITPLIPGKTAIDAFSGIGGSAIGLARAGKKVVSIDSNAERIEMAKFNAKLFKVEPLIDFRIGDSLKILPTLGADSIFLDPPWGGPGYSKQSKFLLEHFAPHGKTLLTISLERAACVVIRLPKNFELTELEQFGRKWRLEENFLSGKLMHYTAFFS